MRFQNADATARTLSWTADADYSVVGIGGPGTIASASGGYGIAAQGQGAVVSFEPLLTHASFYGPPSSVTISKFALGTQLNYSGLLDFPVLTGETIYCAFSAGTNTVMLFLTELVK